MDSASFDAGMMMEIGGGIRSCSSYQTAERLLFGIRLAEADVDVDLGVVGIGGALIVDLVVGFECACAA
jgi:hypothetical protein